VRLNLQHVTYVRTEQEEHRVGLRDRELTLAELDERALRAARTWGHTPERGAAPRRRPARARAAARGGQTAPCAPGDRARAPARLRDRAQRRCVEFERGSARDPEARRGAPPAPSAHVGDVLEVERTRPSWVSTSCQPSEPRAPSRPSSASSARAPPAGCWPGSRSSRPPARPFSVVLPRVARSRSSTPPVDFGCTKATRELRMPVRGVSSISRRPASFSRASSASMSAVW